MYHTLIEYKGGMSETLNLRFWHTYEILKYIYLISSDGVESLMKNADLNSLANNDEWAVLKLESITIKTRKVKDVIESERREIVKRLDGILGALQYVKHVDCPSIQDHSQMKHARTLINDLKSKIQ